MSPETNHEPSYRRLHPEADSQINYDRVALQLLVVAAERTKRAGRDRLLHDEGTADRGKIPTIVFGLRCPVGVAAGDISDRNQMVETSAYRASEENEAREAT